MSRFIQVVGALGVSTILAGPLAAQEQNPFCETHETVASKAIQILNEWCWENDEKVGTIKCNLSTLQIIQFLESCWEKAYPYLDAIYQRTSWEK